MINKEHIQHPLQFKSVNKEVSFRKTKVSTLIIEDNPLIQLVHKEILFKLGCQVDIVSSGEEALSMIDNYYDLILLDIGLPGISGIEVAIKFRDHKKHKKTRMVASTSYNDVVTRNLCLSSGIEKVLNKPINIKDLRLVINPL